MRCASHVSNLDNSSDIVDAKGKLWFEFSQDHTPGAVLVQGKHEVVPGSQARVVGTCYA